MKLFRKKAKIEPVRVMCGLPFIAAYSEHPFTESLNHAAYPDYEFCEMDGLHWCVRVGEMQIPWGFGVDATKRYCANGYLVLSRQNVNAEPFHGKGLPYVRRGKIFYLYECELIDDSLRGFFVFVRSRLLPYVVAIAKKTDPERLQDELKTLPMISEVMQFLNVHHLTMKNVVVKNYEIKKEIKINANEN